MYRPARARFFIAAFFLTFWSNAVGQELTLDQEVADFLMSQGQSDNANRVVLWADAITLRENVEIRGLDLVILANKINTGGLKITLLPQEQIAPTLSGRNGRSVTVVAKEIVKLAFELPGGDGLKGLTAEDGKLGNPLEAERRAGGASRGTNGSKGGTGGEGGDGGSLTVWLVNDETPPVNLSAKGGAGGPGGEGGKGGSTFTYHITKTFSDGRIIWGGPRETKHRDGPTGDEGPAGKDGPKLVEQVDVDRFSDLVLEHIFATPEDLEGRPYQILFKNKLAGVYTLSQMSSGRFAEAYVTKNKNFRAVTRSAQNNNMQRWVFSPVGQSTYRIQQQGTERYLDSNAERWPSLIDRHRDANRLHSRTFVAPPPIVAPTDNAQPQAGAMRHFSGIVGGFATSTEKAGAIEGIDPMKTLEVPPPTLPASALFTADFKDSDSQLWVLKPVGPNTYKIQHKSSRRFIQASKFAWKDFALKLSRAQESPSQHWVVRPVDVN